MDFNKLLSKIKKRNKKFILVSISLLIVLNFLFLTSIVDIAYSSSEPILFNFFDNQRSTSGSYDNAYNIETDINGTSNIYNANLTMTESDLGLIPSFATNILVDSAYYYNQPNPFYLETPKKINVLSDFLWLDYLYLPNSNVLYLSALYNNHKNVLNLTHDALTLDPYLYHYFDDNQTVETYEFFWCNQDATDNIQIIFRSPTLDNVIILEIINDKYYYYNLAGAQIEITGVIPLDNIFAHFKIKFDCNTDIFDLYINEIMRVDNGQFRTITNFISRIGLVFISNVARSTYIDAPSEIWHENYIEGQNLKPFKSDYLKVISGYLGHDYVLYMLDNSNTYERFRVDFDNHMTGNVSFWLAINPILNNNSEIRIRFLDINGQTAGYFFLNNYSLCYYLTYVNTYNLFYSNYYNDVWIHLNFEFDCSTERWHIYFNGIMVANDQVFYNTAYTYSSMNYVEIFSSALAKSEYYFHAFDFSWSDGYYYNRNFFPETIDNPGYQVDNFEFDYNSIDFENNITRFKQSDDANNNVYINKVNDYDSEVVIQNPATHDYTKNKLNMTINAQKYYVKFQTKFEIFNFSKAQDSFWFRFYLQGASQMFRFDNYFSWYSGKIWFILDKNQSLSGYSTVFVMSLLNNVIYDLQIEFDFQSNYYTISIAGSNNSTEYSNMFVGVNFADWVGFNKLECYIDNGNNNHYRNVQIKSLMFKYKSGYNIFDDYTEYEYGQIRYPIGIVDFTLHNLFEFNITSQSKIIGYNNNYNNSHTFVPFGFLTGLRIYNLYYNYVYYNASIGINLYGIFYLIPDLISISGVGLSYSGKISYPLYSFVQSNSVNNYYYVIGSNLYYKFSRTYIDIDASMSLIFDIDDYYVDNNTLLYSSYITNNYLGKIILTDSDLSISEIYSIPNALQLLEYDIITLDNKNLNRITIKVECKADNIAQGYTDGYISQIYTSKQIEIPVVPIYDFEPIETTIIEPDDFREGMIQIGIQLILFVLPSMLSLIFFGKKGVVPMWLLILIIMYIVSYIPFWMVIIQVIAIIGMIILPKNESEVDND